MWLHVNNTTFDIYTNEYKWVDELNIPHFLHIRIKIKPQYVIVKHGRLSNIFLLYIYIADNPFLPSLFIIYRSFFDFHHRGRYYYHTFSCFYVLFFFAFCILLFGWFFFYWFISSDFGMICSSHSFYTHIHLHTHIECDAISKLYRFYLHR